MTFFTASLLRPEQLDPSKSNSMLESHINDICISNHTNQESCSKQYRKLIFATFGRVVSYEMGDAKKKADGKMCPREERSRIGTRRW